MERSLMDSVQKGLDWGILIGFNPSQNQSGKMRSKRNPKPSFPNPSLLPEFHFIPSSLPLPSQKHRETGMGVRVLLRKRSQILPSSRVGLSHGVSPSGIAPAWDPM